MGGNTWRFGPNFQHRQNACAGRGKVVLRRTKLRLLRQVQLLIPLIDEALPHKVTAYSIFRDEGKLIPNKNEMTLQFHWEKVQK